MTSPQVSPEEALLAPVHRVQASAVRHPARVAVFAGSAFGTDPAYLAAARALGREMAGRQIELVYGGTRGGLMGAVAHAARERGGTVIGVVPGHTWKHLHDPVCTLERVPSIHARVERMLDLADGVIVLPGGVGTLHELLAVLAAIQAGEQHLTVGLLNLNDYFAPLLALLQHCQGQGFLSTTADALWHLWCATDPAEMLDAVLGEALLLHRLAQPIVVEGVQ
jgi:uncharacterized protein (TIGR00730 family)